ncbi:MAG: bifunctional diaminohydroxyphosphoribosylaminopyrimidine deaminase/5-amino-6-(5-phosphoribosylamino)uracil reductase RibD [Sandaracinus sp.]
MTSHESAMRAAIAEAERARGKTGDNPWVGCVIVDGRGEVVARGHTQGPGEDHAEIVAMHEAARLGVALSEATLYSTLEPCAFHGRTPACAKAIVTRGVRRVVTGILDPNPRVDGVGLSMLREAGVEVVSDVCAGEIRLQLAPWIFRFHPHEPARFAASVAEPERMAILTARYGVSEAEIRDVLARGGVSPRS